MEREKKKKKDKKKRLQTIGSSPEMTLHQNSYLGNDTDIHIAAAPKIIEYARTYGFTH